MIVHIGWDVCVPSRDIIAILSQKSVLESTETAAFISRAKESGRFTPCPEGERAYLLVQDGEELRVVASAISPATLHKRFASDGVFDV